MKTLKMRQRITYTAIKGMKASNIEYNTSTGRIMVFRNVTVFCSELGYVRSLWIGVD